MNPEILEQPAGLIATIDRVLARSAYDYIIIGGGTAGLLLANRLSEDERTTVLVLEAGPLYDKDALIDTPTKYVDQLNGLAYGWNFQTVPQVGVNNRSISWNRGKGLGGSSNLNFMQWTRPTKVDIDNWERLGNPGWTWDNLLPYFQRSEKFHQESESHVTSAYLPLDSSWLGKDGELPLSYPRFSPTGIPEIRKAFESLGIPSIDNSFSGNNLGLMTSILTIDPNTKTRATSYTSFLRPILSRPNLNVLPGATVTRLILQENSHQDPKLLSAGAVEFLHGGRVYSVKTQHEAILCAGTIGSPHILELSGIGDRDMLSRAGIDVKLHLPGVGENLQDHNFVDCVAFEVKDDLPSLKSFYDTSQSDYTTWQGLQGSALAWVPLHTLTPKAEEIISQLTPQSLQELTSSTVLSNGIKEQRRLLAESLSKSNIPDCELLITHRRGGFAIGDASETGKSYLCLAAGGIYPWSRGSIHAKFKDPLEPPEIEPHYLEHKIDLEILLEGCKFLRRLKDHPSMKNIIVEETSPGRTIITDDDLRDHIRENLLCFYHGTGTLAMLPREKGGVVDTTLKVWGTDNIRVADLSIVPIIVSVHTQSTAYVIAEVAADIIRGRISKLG